MVQATKKQSGPPQKKAAYPYPSRFGSHLSMLNTEKSMVENGIVVLTDEHGDYKTELVRLDNGLADPNRYATSRLRKLFEKSIV